MYGAERGVQLSGNESLPGPGGDLSTARSSQPGRRLSPSVLTVSDANANGANRFNPVSVLTLASCGYAPYISPQRPDTASNGTIDDATLASYVPLANAWLWSPMKPQNSTDINCALASVPSGNSSAARVTSISLSPASCLDISYIACQSLRDPHAWTISSSRFSWINAAAGTLPEEYTARGNGSNGMDAVGVPCPADYFFSVPRTPLQSWALALTLANSTAKSAWVFLSDSRSEGCWTVGGLKCRYGQNKDQRYDIITVSLFGGLLVLLLFGIFLWVKWRRYNRVSREESRAAMAKRKLKQIEYTSIPVRELLMSV
ncbi:hypothetical protein BCR44DRAFT_128480 [Catenaria anguillulae PL171]|uniref:Uncharacterized protein n=1 Tax=Catenaria anguillulae PL171 TaxID=765915 RepID=A0A1Y2HDU1_9FUNG|nr:hypothetical protein BCR44DRAFT_128480 [Catenaria anguillulae PL171]